MAKLSPPWYTAWNEINAAIGKTPGIKVNPLVVKSNPTIVPIQVQNRNQAVALASILAPQINPYVTVQVTDGEGTVVAPAVPANAQELASMFQTALAGNPFLTTVQVRPFAPFPTSPAAVFPIFAPAVIQFYNDDISDFYGNFNATATSVFENILNTAPGGIQVLPSTAKQA